MMSHNRCDGFVSRYRRERVCYKNTNLRRILWAVMAVLTFLSYDVFANYGGGNGSENDPFLIFTPLQLSRIGSFPDDWDKSFKLMADVDMKDFNGRPGREAFAIIGYMRWEPYTSKPFKGVFDGNKKRISNLSIKTGGRDFVGLFGFIQGPAACIKNVTLVNPVIDAGDAMYVGAIAGRLKTGTIINCTVEQALISGGDCVGGIAGYNASGRIRDCSVTASVNGYINVGGVTGYHCGVEISKCSFDGMVYGFDDVGGIAGESDSEIMLCGVTGDVKADEDKVAGLVGTLRGSVKCCFAKGSVEGKNEVGGLVGRNAGLVRDSYARSHIMGGDYVGGLAGLLYDTGVVSKSYTVCQIDAGVYETQQFIGWADQGEVSASFWPENDSNLIEMKMLDTYITAGWDFVGESQNGNLDLWDICDGAGFPRLAWQDWLPGDFECPEGVDIIDIAILAEQWLARTSSLDLVGGLGDNIVNFRDLSIIASSWRTKTGWPAYNYLCDLSPDGSINLYDLSTLAENWLARGYNKADIFSVRGNGIVDFADWVLFANAWKSVAASKNWNVKCDVAPRGGDGVVDFDDLVEFTGQWLGTGAGLADIAPAGRSDGIVNLFDFALAAQSYLQQD
ncbi:MAG: hypothetical protein JW749_08815 [Sedimentisphaerales bacterium]|nr:hypothetical protein [Sedimentisphaerales bacterium]